MKKKLLVLALVIFTCAFNGFAGGRSDNSGSRPNSIDEGYGTRTVIDMSDNEVTVTGKIDRVVNLWPAGTSSFFAMGAGELIVATGNAFSVTQWSKFFYADADKIPNLGSTSPSVEAIINLKPDLVVVHPSTAATMIPALKAVGIPAVNINFSDYATMKKAYTILGTLLGGQYKSKLETWCNMVDKTLALVRGKTANLTAAQKPLVYYIAGQNSNDLTVSFNAVSIMTDWVESAGGRWLAKELNVTGTNITAEAVWAADPDIIICGGSQQHVNKGLVMTTAGWKDLKASKNGRVYTNPYVLFNWDRFGLESLLQAKYALTVIHPELAGDIDMRAEVIEFYRIFADKELTAVQADYMLQGRAPDGTLYNASTAF
jgi:iron complex transport system substrate-binding protein